MTPLPDYTIHEYLYRGRNSLVARAVNDLTQQPVIVKFLNIKYPSPGQVARFKHEYEVTKHLHSKLGDIIIAPYELVEYQNSYAIILEDFGASSLAQFLAKQPLEISQFLHLAIRIVDIVRQIHQQHILIKDINPTNILLNPSTDTLKMSDFDISTELSFENLESVSLSTIEGTLPYIAPESTRRINRAVDYRSDYYSMGITFYEMLVGNVPFQSQNMMELIHAHIAKQPRPPAEINSKIPAVLSDIIMKLLRKTPEERYQSANGLLIDLKKCQEEYNTTQYISFFPIASNDVPSTFHLSEKLYGRDSEIKILTHTFHQVCTGKKELMLISGYSGIGKTALIQELYKSIALHNGFFISGKCDQFMRNIPYQGLVDALKKLIEQILTEPEEQVLKWRRLIQQAVGPNGKLIIDVIPQVKFLIGPQPEPIDVGLSEIKNRFSFVFEKFIQVFASPDHPLTIFLDDLQWADIPTLELMTRLLTNPDIKHLFLIGAYRNNEVSPSHILMLALDDLKKNGISPITLDLPPLQIPHIRQMLADILYTSPDHVETLTEIIYNKTQGNPFFINRLLLSLYKEGLIYYHSRDGSWHWDSEKIRKKEISENVVDFMSQKILTLPANTRRVLSFAACLGNRFDLKVLSQVDKKTQKEILGDLWPAMQEGLVIPENENYRMVEEPTNLEIPYHFLHDKVRQAIYTLPSEDDRLIFHHKLGNILLENTPLEKLEEKVFEIVYQFNLSAPLMVSPSEKMQLIELNIRAAKKAKASSAFKAAANYFKMAYLQLPSNTWNENYNLTFDLTQELSSCLYIVGEHEEAEAIIRENLSHAKTVLEKAEIIIMQVSLYSTAGKMNEAIEAGLKGLDILGMHVPYHPTLLSILAEFFMTKWNQGFRSIASLVDLPRLTDPSKKMLVKLIQETCVSAYHIGNKNLTALLILKQVNAYLRYGNSGGAGLAYNAYAMLLTKLGDLKKAFEYGKLSLKLCELFPGEYFKGRVSVTYAMMIHGWNYHWRTLKSYFKEAIEEGLETGDFLTCSHGCSHILLWDPELRIDEVVRESQKYLDIIKEARSPNTWDATKLQFQVRANLCGLTNGLYSLSDSSFNEQECVQRMEKAKFFAGLAIYLMSKSMVHYLYGDLATSLDYLKKAEPGMEGFFGTLFYVEYTYFSFYIYSALYPQQKGLDRIKARIRLKKEYKKVKKWSNHCPTNFLHHQLLMEAEMARLAHQKEKAAQLYDQAIYEANRQGFIRDEALANELAAVFYLKDHKEKIAKLYLQEAQYGYQKWGAEAKVKHLEKTYSKLLQPLIKQNPLVTTTTSISTGSTTTHVLDVISIMKASQSLAREIQLPNLIEKMMGILIENAGAEKGWLLLEKEGNYYVKAIVDNDNIQIMPFTPITDLPLSIIKTVINTKEPVLLEDVTQENSYSSDSYIKIHRPKSILCYPLLNIGELKGILYLENRLAPNVFTQERLDIIGILSSQMAISINNASLYEKLEEEVAKRTKDLKNTQNQLVQKEKMAFLGMVTIGIAHEIKNPLNFIINFSSFEESSIEEIQKLLQEHLSRTDQNLLKKTSPILESLKENTRHIRDQGKKADGIVNRMLEHSFEPTQNFVFADLHLVIERAINLYYHQMRPEYKKLEVIKHFDHAITYVELSEIDFQRVILNLLDNAYYSVFKKWEKEPETFTPHISISTLDKTDSIEIRVEDNGVGIPLDSRDKIFTPFFSTRPTGQGVGLGLSLCYTIIVKEHGGSLTFHSTPDELTDFIITIPRVQDRKK